MTIRDELSSYYKWKDNDGTFAVEIETETNNEQDYQRAGVDLKVSNATGNYMVTGLNGWDIKPDGSLRNFGLEFVSKKPLGFDEIKSSLLHFDRKFTKVPFLKDAPATSVHVHVNALPLTFTQLGNFLTLWALFENILVEYSGEGRRSNLFALPNRVAEGCYKNIVSMFNQLDSGAPNGLKWNQETVKYAALNIGRLASLGSIEIRCFRGTTDVFEIINWITVLNDLYEYAKTPGLDPRMIVQRYQTIGCHELFSEVFYNSPIDFRRVANHVDLHSYVRRNIWYAAMISDSVKNWSRLDTYFSEKNKKTKTGKTVKKPQPSDFVYYGPDGEELVNWTMYENAVNNWANGLIDSQIGISPWAPSHVTPQVIGVEEDVVPAMPVMDDDLDFIGDDSD